MTSVYDTTFVPLSVTASEAVVDEVPIEIIGNTSAPEMELLSVGADGIAAPLVEQVSTVWSTCVDALVGLFSMVLLVL